MQELSAQPKKSFTLFSSIVGLLVSLIVGQTNPADIQETPKSTFDQIIFRSQQLENPGIEATIPQATATRELPDLSEKNYRVGIQVGHFENENPPAELAWLKGNTGAHSHGLWEDEVVGVIVVQAKEILEAQGVEVDVLPAVVPPGYRADAYVSVHTDGSDTNKDASGFKVAPSAKDRSGLARKLSAALDKAYEEESGMRRDGNNITRNMTHHYSFNSDRFHHSISPHTPGALLETGFLTNENDREIIVDKPEISARGLAYGILYFLDDK